MATNHEHYDYIIAGAGSSGLTLAWQLVEAGLGEKNLLVIDRDLDPENDKTWCFWHEGDPPFPELIVKSWDHASVYPGETQITQPLAPYRYHCIRNGDFRETLLNRLRSAGQVTVRQSEITQISGTEQSALLKTEEETIRAEYIFQSCIKPGFERRPRYPLLQHFLGWEVEANGVPFDPSSFLLMDFDEAVTDGVGFMYILPWSTDRALFEYTLFSPTTLPVEHYEHKLEVYLDNKYGLSPLNYAITRKEYGEIPMNDGQVSRWYAPRVLNLGMAGGLTKPSTGYTFSRIQKHATAIVEALKETGSPEAASDSEYRYRLYDLWLLQILHDQPGAGLEVFRDLFTRNDLPEIFRFLGEQTSLMQDLSIMSSVPWKPFFRAIWETRDRMLDP